MKRLLLKPLSKLVKPLSKLAKLLSKLAKPPLTLLLLLLTLLLLLAKRQPLLAKLLAPLLTLLLLLLLLLPSNSGSRNEKPAFGPGRLLTKPPQAGGFVFSGHAQPPAAHQHRLEMLTLEALVPADHLLRLIDRHIPFDFIHDVTAHLYCADNGRPAVDPAQLFKMRFIGYLFGIRSERQLVREIKVNVAYRGFLGLVLTDRVFDATAFS